MAAGKEIRGKIKSVENTRKITKAMQMVSDQPFIDELPYRLLTWLQTEPGKKWAKRFQTIIVDEFQDIMKFNGISLKPSIINMQP